MSEEMKRYRATKDWEEYPDGAFVRFEDVAAYGERCHWEGRAAGIEEMREAVEVGRPAYVATAKWIDTIASRLLASAPPEQDDLSPEALASVKRGLAQKATIDRDSFATYVEGTETITTSEATKRALAPAETPNAVTRQAMADTDAGRGVTATGVNNLFVKLDAPDIPASSEASHANILKTVSSEWEHTESPGEVHCHSRMIEGVLCRWWGRDTPPGVAMIDRAVLPETPDAFANDWNRARADKALAGAQEPDYNAELRAAFMAGCRRGYPYAEYPEKMRHYAEAEALRRWPEKPQEGKP
jgi:hypothetical protein